MSKIEDIFEKAIKCMILNHLQAILFFDTNLVGQKFMENLPCQIVITPDKITGPFLWNELCTRSENYCYANIH